MNPTTLNQLIASFANDSRLAICYDDQRLSFAELAEQVALEQQRFQNQGLCNGDILLLPVHKQAKNVILLLAALSTASATLVYPKLMPEQRLAELQQHATVFMNTDGNLVRLQTPAPALSQQNDPLLGVLSSGSTGEPKRIWHRVSHFLASAQASNQVLPLTTSDSTVAFVTATLLAIKFDVTFRLPSMERSPAKQLMPTKLNPAPIITFGTFIFLSSFRFRKSITHLTKNAQHR